MRTREAFVFVAVFTVFLPSAASAALVTAPITVSPANSPLAGCDVSGQSGTTYPNTEVEPWIAVNPKNNLNVVGTWQQDRWSNGAARGSGVAVSTNGGTTFTTSVIPGLTTCSGGTRYQRASDPWLSFAGNGTLYAMSLVETKLATGVNLPSGMMVSRSLNGGVSWGTPTIVIEDTDGNHFNDKNSFTADPVDPRYAYAIWDRLDTPIGKGSISSAENAFGYRGPTWLARTTDGGDSWEPARQIYAPGNNDQTIGNQIVVRPNGNLVNLFNLIRNDNKGKVKGFSVAVIRSSDKGATWSQTPVIVSRMNVVQVTDPDTGALVRTGDIIPEVAIDRVSGAIYAVWQDGRWSGGARSDIAFSRSLDGGLTWSSPVRINAPRGVSAFTPGISVAADGTVGVDYYDFRNNTPAAGVPTDVWFTSCSSGCIDPTSWRETHIDGPFDMQNAPVARGYFLGDYIGNAAAGRTFHLLYSVAGGSPSTADVRYAKVTI
jgi:hypothetical protein